MIPRILVPKDARPPARDEVSTRRRPTTLDERLLVPSGLPLVHLDGVSTIPANLPLDTIAARVVVPRDLNVAEVQRRDESTLPAQPTELDERITIPQGVVPPAEFSPLTITRSSFHSAIRPGRRALTMVRPERPITSPMKRMRITSGSAEIDHLALR